MVTVEESPVEIPRRSPTPPSNEPVPVPQSNASELQLPVRPDSRQFSVTGSVSSSMTAIQPSIRVEINGRINATSVVANQSKSRADQSTILTARQRKQSTSPTREQLARKR